MKRLLFSLIFVCAGIVCFAQDNRAAESSFQSSDAQLLIGYLSYDAALQAMPQYASVQQQMDSLRQAYDREMKRVQDEFNQKYETFLEERAQYPRTILLKRQNELQDMMQRNIDFRAQGQRDLQEAELMAMKPLHERLKQAIKAVAAELRLAVVVNTDSETCPYIDPEVSLDLTDHVAQLLSAGE